MARSPREQRQFGRRRTLIHAMIVTPKGGQMSCIVRNISQGGALLEVRAPETLPINFKLIISSDRFAADCEVRHRSANGVGVLFAEVRIGRGGRDTRDAAPSLEGMRTASPVQPAH